MKKYFILLFLIAGGAYTSLNAQEYRTDISIREQIKNNSVPGQKYNSETPVVKRTEKVAENTGMTLKQQIQQGKLGMPVKTGGATMSTKPVAKKTEGVTLSSEKSATEIKAEVDKKAAERPATTTLPPSQEEVKENNVQPSKTKTD